MISCILFIVIILLIIFNKNKSLFTNRDSIHFLTVREGCEVLKNVNNLFNYTNLDYSLRNINNSIYKNDVHKFYCDNLLEFTEKDKMLLKWLVDHLKKKTPKKWKFIYEYIKFAKYENHIENGFPHTQSDTIFITGFFINNIIYYFNNNDVKNAIKDLGSIIVHECVHVWQRKEPEKFMKLYTYYWHFIKANKIKNGDSLKKLNRYNPDGIDLNWVFNYKNKYIWLLSLYNNDAKNISNVKYVGVFLDKLEDNVFSLKDNKDNKHENLLDIPEFTIFFNNITGNHYHPNELSAELISIFYLKQMRISHKKFTNKAYENMLIWLRDDV